MNIFENEKLYASAKCRNNQPRCGMAINSVDLTQYLSSSKRSLDYLIKQSSIKEIYNYSKFLPQGYYIDCFVPHVGNKVKRCKALRRAIEWELYFCGLKDKPKDNVKHTIDVYPNATLGTSSICNKKAINNRTFLS